MGIPLKHLIQRRMLCAFYLGIAWFAILSFANPAHASGPAAERWRTISTPHFRVNYHKGVEKMTKDVAIMCEDAHELLAKEFDFTPDRKTEVILLDASESANGSANTFPRATINLYAVPSASYDTRGDTGHWMWEMVLHEYAHILHMEQIYGWIRILNIPFGRQLMPNQNLPRWMLEGTATAIESRYTGRGRIHSNFYRMYLDAALLDETIPTLAQLSNQPPKFPYANLWYLAGGFFIEYIAETYGWEALFEAYAQQARRLRPWAVNFMLWKTIGKTADALYEEWIDYAKNKAKKRARLIANQGLIEPTPRTQTGHDTRWIAATPHGAFLHWIRSDGKDDATLVAPDHPNARRIRVRTSSPFTLSPDGRYALISRSARVRDGYSRNDLWRVDLETGKMRRFTRGLRASEPAWSPDGRTIAYVRPKDGRFDLHVYDIASKTSKRVARADDWTTYGQPAWSPDGKYLYASLSAIGGGRNLFAFNTRDYARTQLTDGVVIHDSPRVSPDGRWLYFSSDRDGTYNIYARDLQDSEACTPTACDTPSKAKDFRVTRVRTGVFQPVVVQQNDGCALWMSTFSSRGFDVAEFALQDDCSPPRAPSNAQTSSDDAEKGAQSAADASDEEPPRDPEDTPSFKSAQVRAEHKSTPTYRTPVLPSESRDDLSRPKRYLTGIRAQPWTWSPIYQNVGPHRQVGFSTHGEDPASRFAWRADLSIGDPFNQLRWAIDLRFRMTTPEFYVNTSRSVNRGTMRVNSEVQPYDQMVTTVSVGTGYNFSGIRAAQRVDLSYNWDRREFWDRRVLHHDPGGLRPILPVLGDFNNLYLSYSLSNLRSYTRSVSQERGWSFRVGLRLRARWLGAHYDSRELSFAVQKAVPIHRWDKHAFVVRLLGAAAQSRFDRPIGYAIGGIYDQNLWEALQNQLGASTQVVRGYQPGILRGGQYLLANAEYRFPLLWIDWGHSTLPFFLERIHGAFFVDAATTFEPTASGQSVLVGVGGEIRIDLTLGYYLPQALRLGVARGLGPEGMWQGYVLLGRSF